MLEIISGRVQDYNAANTFKMKNLTRLPLTWKHCLKSVKIRVKKLFLVLFRGSSLSSDFKEQKSTAKYHFYKKTKII